MIDLSKSTPLFPLGRLLATPAAIALGIDFTPYICRHHYGDWGDCDPEDWKSNDESVNGGYRILSAYQTPKGRLWIITEADRSATTILLPSDY